MTRHDTMQPRALSNAEMQQAGGGAIYMKVEGVRGDVTVSAHGAGGGGGAGKVSVHDISM